MSFFTFFFCLLAAAFLVASAPVSNDLLPAIITTTCHPLCITIATATATATATIVVTSTATAPPVNLTVIVVNNNYNTTYINNTVLESSSPSSGNFMVGKDSRQ
jgi:hypothetical protein